MNSKSPFEPFERIGTTGGRPGHAEKRPGIQWKSRLFRGPLFILAILLVVFWWRADGPGEASAGETAKSGSALKLDAPNRDSGAKGAGGVLPGSLPANFSGEAADRQKTTGQKTTGQKTTGASNPKTRQKEPSKPTASKALGRPIESVIAKWMQTAKEKSKGKITSKNTVVAVHVRELNGDVLVSRNTSRGLKPASNLKLLTAASALVLGGPNAEVVTSFDAVGKVSGGELHGDLVVRAGADPLYRDKGDGSLDVWLDPLAEQLKAAGIRKVTGKLILDEGHFGRPGPAEEWPAPGEFWKEYCALSGGFSANAGCMTTVVRPTEVNKEANVQIRPRGHGLNRSKGRVKTTAKGDIKVAVEARGSRLIVRGSLPKKTPSFTARFAHPDPVELFGHAIVAGLARRDIGIQGGMDRHRGVPGGNTVASLRSPISSTLGPILLESNNSVSDQVFLWLGHHHGGAGTRAGGAKAVQLALTQIGVPTTGLVQVDGSGLSKANRVRPDQFTALLASVLLRSDEAARKFRRSLPVAGESGSLRRRMRSGPAHRNVLAKTGFVNGVSTLSGLVQTADGRDLVFSIMVNYKHVGNMNNQVFKPMQDEICQLLAGFEGELR